MKDSRVQPLAIRTVEDPPVQKKKHEKQFYEKELGTVPAKIAVFSIVQDWGRGLGGQSHVKNVENL